MGNGAKTSTLPGMDEMAILAPAMAMAERLGDEGRMPQVEEVIRTEGAFDDGCVLWAMGQREDLLALEAAGPEGHEEAVIEASVYRGALDGFLGRVAEDYASVMSPVTLGFPAPGDPSFQEARETCSGAAGKALSALGAARERVMTIDLGDGTFTVHDGELLADAATALREKAAHDAPGRDETYLLGLSRRLATLRAGRLLRDRLHARPVPATFEIRGETFECWLCGEQDCEKNYYEVTKETFERAAALLVEGSDWGESRYWHDEKSDTFWFGKPGRRIEWMGTHYAFDVAGMHLYDVWPTTLRGPGAWWPVPVAKGQGEARGAEADGAQGGTGKPMAEAKENTGKPMDDVRERIDKLMADVKLSDGGDGRTVICRVPASLVADGDEGEALVYADFPASRVPWLRAAVVPADGPSRIETLDERDLARILAASPDAGMQVLGTLPIDDLGRLAQGVAMRWWLDGGEPFGEVDGERERRSYDLRALRAHMTSRKYRERLSQADLRVREAIARL